jgi:hypothetical protein
MSSNHHHKLFKKFVFGTPDEDVLNGTNRHDILFGFGGDDRIFGLRGNDIAFGGRGDDRVDGGKDHDILFGEHGNDGLAGGEGNDDLHGGGGRDFVVGGAGKDELTGGGGPDKFVLRQGSGIDTIKDLQSNDRIDLRDYGFASAEDVLDAFRQRGHDAVLDLGGGNKLIIKDTRVSQLDAAQFIVLDAATGPSSSQSPYVVGVDAAISTVSLLTVGDETSDGTGWQMVGIPDGLGAFDNGDGTFTVLMNHELGATEGVVRDHGFAGAFVSKLVIDKTTLEVLSGEDLIQHAFAYNPATGNYEPLAAAIGRLCSADLPAETAFFNPETGLGYNGGRIFMSGEEVGNEGRAFAHFVNGDEAGNSYELAWLGNMSYENHLANPYTGDETVVALTDDTGNINSAGNTIATGNGEVYFYFGDKKSTGDALTDTGLTGGNLYALKVSELPVEGSTNATPLGADGESKFNLVNLGDVSGLSGAQIQTLSDAAGATKFLRPEDGAWDTVSTNRFYFVTTGNISSPDAPSRLWAVDFNGVPSEAGLSGPIDGTVRLLVEGSAADGNEMFDNITVTKDGKVILQEDVGNNARLGKIWEYDPATDTLTVLAQHDPDRFDPAAPVGGEPFLTADEESSGIIDVTDILGSAGQNVFLFDVQSHNTLGGELVQGGQLGLLYQDLI